MMAAPPPAPPGYAVVRQLDLQSPLHLPTPWTLVVEAPTGQDAATADAPVRLCFEGPARKTPDCQPIEHDGYRFQTFVSAAVETLSQSQGRRALVVRASYSGGSHALTRTIIWSYEGYGFLQTFATDIGDLGEERRVSSGPLDGYYVQANFAFTRSDETWWDPHRYSVTVDRLGQDGSYLQVLQYITQSTYPAERERSGQVIDGELATIQRLLRAAYPAGPPP